MEARDWDRIAPQYHSEVISPFQEGVENPLPGALRRLRGAGRLDAAEFGCGTGALLPLLSSRFRHVTAIDFSERMLSLARRQPIGRNVRFLRRDLRDLHGCRERFDAAITVNAVLSPDAREVNDILRGIHDSLRPGGRLIAIFPAMEPVLYQAMLIHEQEMHATSGRKRALARTRRRLERGKFNFELGLYDDGKLSQKFYYDFEIRYRLRRAGFRWVRLGKVFYPWDEERIGYEMFPGEPRMWDWFVTARRPRARA
ncbi:MAG: class I SAM-dependent methyltransferase [Deltaproteobacteria bacterium]|nr:class I SAM-dependent methyltransferase [Deltaproteobacteria bacterium]